MLRKLPPLVAWSSALIAALVGFGGTVALVVQAMRTLGASVAETSSAVTALCLGVAVTGAILSFRLRVPIVLAWSTPGAALLAAAAPGITWPVAIGVFVASALLMLVFAAVPLLGGLVQRIPTSLGSAMLAGVLFPFCLGLFRLSEADPVLVGALVLTFIVARQRLPRYALLLVLTVGVSITAFRGDGVSQASHITWGKLVPVLPVFEPTALFSLAVPLFLVTLVSQNLPGLVVLRTAGYQPPPRTLLVGTSLASLLMASFGAHSVNLAAITAALCTSDEAHPERNRRWTVGMLYALYYLVLAALSPVLVRLFLALPKAAIAALTGVALIPSLTSAMDSMLAAKDQRDAASLTFLTTASGVAMFGLGSAFWGLLVGFAALGASALLRRTKTQS